MSGKEKKIDNISLSRRTVTRRIGELATSIDSELNELATNFVHYSLALNESTDATSTAQLGIFVRGIDRDFNIIKEMLSLQAMKDTTTGNDIFEKVKISMTKFNLQFQNLHGLSTDGAPAIVDSTAGVTSILRRELASNNIDTQDFTQFTVFHCIIHQENLCAKSLKFEHFMSKVVSSINFIKYRPLNHGQFQEFLQDVEAEYGDLIYYCEVRWLSKGKMLKRFYDLRGEIATFMDIKGKVIRELSDDNWVRDLAFLVDLTTDFYDSNTKLQGKGQFLHHLYYHVRIFESKLQLWEKQLRKCNIFHFPTLASCEQTDCAPYAAEIVLINTEFNNRFQNFRSQEASLWILSSPFDVIADQAPEEFQMKLIELQGNDDLKWGMRDYSLLDFYKKLPEDSFPKITDLARKKMSLFNNNNPSSELLTA